MDCAPQYQWNDTRNSLYVYCWYCNTVVWFRWKTVQYLTGCDSTSCERLRCYVLARWWAVRSWRIGSSLTDDKDFIMIGKHRVRAFELSWLSKAGKAEQWTCSDRPHASAVKIVPTSRQQETRLTCGEVNDATPYLTQCRLVSYEIKRASPKHQDLEPPRAITSPCFAPRCMTAK